MLSGVSSAKIAYTPQGVPTHVLWFAIPAYVFRDTVAQFRQVASKTPAKAAAAARDQPEDGSTRTEKLFGMQLQDLTQELTSALGFAPGRGVLISSVESDSPAEDAGIQKGLVIYKI